MLNNDLEFQKAEAFMGVFLPCLSLPWVYLSIWMYLLKYALISALYQQCDFQ